MTLLPESRESHIPGSSRSGTSPFGPMAHVSVTDKHHSPFSTSGPPGGVQGLLTRNSHIPPRDIVAHLTTGLGGGCREGKEVAPFWNSVLFPSQRRSLSLPAWTSASSSVTLCDTEGQCGVYHSTGWPPDASLQARPSSLGLQGTFPTQQPSTEPPGAPPAFQDRPRIQKKVLLLEQENPGPVLLSSRKPQSMIPAQRAPHIPSRPEACLSSFCWLPRKGGPCFRPQSPGNTESRAGLLYLVFRMSPTYL